MFFNTRTKKNVIFIGHRKTLLFRKTRIYATPYTTQKRARCPIYRNPYGQSRVTYRAHKHYNLL